MKVLNRTEVKNLDINKVYDEKEALAIVNVFDGIIDYGINPAHFCFECGEYIGFRGFCKKKCHDEWYDKEYPEE